MGVQLEVGLKVIRGQTYKSPNLRPGVGFVNWVIYTSVPESHFQLHPTPCRYRRSACALASLNICSYQRVLF